MINHIETVSAPLENIKLTSILKAFKWRVTKQFFQMEEKYKAIFTEQQEIIHKKNKEIRHLIKERDLVISDNYLLEYKKKDLMLLADQLEEAFEEISQKNQELAEQKKQIQEQAEKINAINKQISKNNDELIQQKEFILDQAEYLEEANVRLSRLNSEIQLQKDEILKKNEELTDLNTEKNNLIHIVAHDLKSPLNQIKGLISIIKYNTDKLSEESVNCLGLMEGSVNRLNEMIAKILDVKAIEAQKLNVSLENCNLSAIAKECALRHRLTAGEKEIQLVEEIADELFAEADKGLIYQVLENLLSNAIKFSERSTSIYFSLAEKEGRVLLAVKDQGPGINKEDKKKLFKKFQKLSAKPTGNEISTGLGLSIVKKFVEAMGGDIWCESEEGKGTTFFVRLKAIHNTLAPEGEPVPA